MSNTESATTDGLLPCPFCGGVTAISSGYSTSELPWCDDGGTFYRAFCTSCQSRQLFARTIAESTEAWNRRADTLLAASRAEVEALRQERDKLIRHAISLGDVIVNHSIAMQAAVIEWYGSGTADTGMAWIENTLDGPGMLPDMKEASELGGAQAWFDAKMAEHEAFRAANPGPARAALSTNPTKG